MKIKIMLLAIAVLVFASCSQIGLSDSTVRFLGIGIGYTNSSTQLGYYDDKNSELMGTLRDVVSFGTAYKDLWDKKNIYKSKKIKLDFQYMLESGPDKGPTVGGETSEYANFPTKNNVIEKIKEIGRNATENDLFVLFYSGHGRNQSGDLCLIRDDLKCNTSSEFKKYYGYNYLSPEELFEILDTIKGYKVLIFDSCYSGKYSALYSNESGDISAGLNQPNKNPSAFLSTKLVGSAKTFVIAATQYNNVSYGADDYGFLTEKIIGGMGWNNYIKDRVQLDSKSVGLKFPSLGNKKIGICEGMKNVKVNKNYKLTSGELFSYASKGLHYEQQGVRAQEPNREANCLDVLMVW